MTVLERIKMLCRERKNISITTLEQTLSYSNGSLSKAKDIPSSRIMEIAMFLGVSTDYILTGNEMEYDVEMAETDVKLSNMDNRMKEYALKMNKLSHSEQELIMQMIDKLSEK